MGLGPYIFPHTRVEQAFWICEHCSNSRVHTRHSPHPPSSIFHLITIMIDVETLWNFHLSSWKLLHCFHLPLSLHLFSWEFLHESRHFSLFFLTQFQGKFRLIRWDWFNWETGYRLDYLVWIPGHVDLCCLFPCMRVPRSTYGQWLFWCEVYPIWNSHWMTQKVILISMMALVKYN